MNLFQKATVMVTAAFLLPLCILGEEKSTNREKQINIDPKVIHEFTVSLLELGEDTQHKHLSVGEIEEVAKILATAKYEKEMKYLDGVRTPYISRYQFRHSYLGGTPKSGQSQSGMLTIDARTLYWKKGIYTLDAQESAKLLKIFPKPVNPKTVSERPEAEVDERKAEQGVAPQSATRPESKSEGGDIPQPESEARSR